MVQLQADLEKFKTAGIQIVAISYDSVDVLKTFSKQKKIEFPLLSDEGSAVIRAMKLEFKDGLPHPGTFLIDTEGIVRGKIFRDGYKQRHRNDELLEEVEKLELVPVEIP